MRARSLVLLTLALAGCFSGQHKNGPRELRVRRGTLTSSIVLTGELDAARGEAITVPTLPNWQTSVKWLATDGTEVKQGERVVELDNSTFTADLDSKRQSELQARQELQQRSEEWKADLAQKQLDFEKKASELEKAKIDAAVPADIQSAREYQEKQMQLQRAKVEFEKSRDLLRAQQQGVEAERRNLQIRLQKAEREIHLSEQAIEALVLRAPRDGIVVIRDHPWEGRKLQAGDTVFVGFPLAVIPEMSSLRVSAALADVDDGRVAIGMPASITLDGYPGLTFTGRVSSISAVAQESARLSLRRAFRVIVSLDRIDAQRMRPGLSARVTVVRENAPDALLAPRAALDLGAKKPQARLAGGKRVDVSVGACNAQECVVTSGLQEGQRLARINEESHG